MTMDLDQIFEHPLDPEVNPAQILVADDEPDLEILFRQLFRKEIRNKEFAFTFVGHGLEALEILEHHAPFDMVLSDIRMPKMDGLQLLENLNRRFPMLKTVMVTAYGDMDNIRKAMNMGAFDFISKPIQYKDLKTTILKTLNHVRELRELQEAREEKLRSKERMVAELQKVNAMKDEFLANTSHELRTPLNGMIGLLESSLSDSANLSQAEKRKNLELILASGHRLTNLINDILDFSKLKNEEMSIEKRPVDVRAIVEIVVTLSRPLIGQKPLKIENQIQRQLPPVLADENRLQQILYNLLGNAIKFTERGEVTLSATTYDNWVEISVRDTGIGIPQDKFAQIFEPFEQVDGSTVRSFGGTGLGLSITKKLVTLHGGDLRLESREGEGSLFSFTLPIAKEDAGRPVLVQMPSPYLERKPVISLSEPAFLEMPIVDLPQDSEHQILIVDDDPVNMQVLRTQLKEYHTQSASSGPEALEILAKEGPFDLVVLDVMMPKMSGYEVCKIIRQTYRPNELPVILLTAKNQVSDLVAGFECGANDFLTKPISKGELLARIKTQLDLVDLQRKLQETQAAAVANARIAGKADFATTVLHNIGNILTSLSVSSGKISQCINESRVSTGLPKACRMIEENQDNLAQFLGQDSRGKNLPKYLIQLGSFYENDAQLIQAEVDNMRRRIELMKEIIETQQIHAKEEAAIIPLFINDIVHESINVQESQLERQEIKVKLRLELERIVYGHPTILIHILVNLIKNAIEAMFSSQERQLRIETGEDSEGQCYCSVSDTGEGIPDLDKLFAKGFTTKKFGHGFGLYYCRQAMESIGGNLVASSAGAGQGATFKLILPTKPSIPIEDELED